MFFNPIPKARLYWKKLPAGFCSFITNFHSCQANSDSIIFEKLVKVQKFLNTES